MGTNIEGGNDRPGITHQLNNASGYSIEKNAGFKWENVNGTKRKVYTKYFTGKTDNDSLTTITHGEDFDKILSVTSMVFNGTNYVVSEAWITGEANNNIAVDITSTEIRLNDLSANLWEENYRVKMEYYL